MYRQRIREESRSSLLTSEMRYSSPLQGVKVVVSNLEESVTQEDLTELYNYEMDHFGKFCLDL